MRIKLLFISLFALLFSTLVSCDDSSELFSVGSSVRPDGDSVFVGVDTVVLKARTISMNDSVYARTAFGLLGEYEDEVYGKIKSDYLTELYTSQAHKFKDKIVSIDSVGLTIGVSVPSGFLGDESKLTGLSVYEVNKPLEKNYYTNIKPEDYCDFSKPLGQASFVYKDLTTYSYTQNSVIYYYKLITAKLDTILANRFVSEWKNNPNTFASNEEFNKFFPGVYVTNTYGNGNLITVNSTSLSIHYKYLVGRNFDDTADSIAVATFTMDAADEVVQMNRVENQLPSSLDYNDPNKTYLKTPAGLYTEVTIPLGEIITKVGEGRTINSATFSIKGLTEEEEKLDVARPNYLLFINKDSIDSFFEHKKIQNSVTSLLMHRDAVISGINVKQNIYYFNPVNNISSLITYYIDKYKDAPNKESLELKYLIIPVKWDSQLKANSAGGSYYVTTSLANMMTPSSAILRTDPKNMKMSFVFSQYNKK